MSSLALPPRYRNIPALESLQSRAQGLMKRNRELKQETKGSVGTMESVGLTQLGAALTGVGMARGWTEGSLGMVGGALAAFGIAFGQSAAVHVANGVLCPLTAGMAAKWYATSVAGTPAGV